MNTDEAIDREKSNKKIPPVHQIFLVCPAEEEPLTCHTGTPARGWKKITALLCFPSAEPGTPCRDGEQHPALLLPFEQMQYFNTAITSGHASHPPMPPPTHSPGDDSSTLTTNPISVPASALPFNYPSPFFPAKYFRVTPSFSKAEHSPVNTSCCRTHNPTPPKPTPDGDGPHAHLQWMTMGPASGGVDAFTRRMKASSPVA